MDWVLTACLARKYSHHSLCPRPFSLSLLPILHRLSHCSLNLKSSANHDSCVCRNSYYESAWGQVFSLLLRHIPRNPTGNKASFRPCRGFVPVCLDLSVCTLLRLCQGEPLRTTRGRSARSWLSSFSPQTEYRPMTIVWRDFHTSIFTSQRDGPEQLSLPVT